MDKDNTKNTTNELISTMNKQEFSELFNLIHQTRQETNGLKFQHLSKIA
jgi:hypothetical protein